MEGAFCTPRVSLSDTESNEERQRWRDVDGGVRCQNLRSRRALLRVLFIGGGKAYCTPLPTWPSTNWPVYLRLCSIPTCFHRYFSLKVTVDGCLYARAPTTFLCLQYSCLLTRNFAYKLSYSVVLPFFLMKNVASMFPEVFCIYGKQVLNLRTNVSDDVLKFTANFSELAQ